jgi:methylthioribulose-1-phosphate dehydratase
MSYDPEKLKECAGLIATAGRDLYRRGWTPATSSNFSMRLGKDACAITVSGRHKGELGVEDVMAVDLDGHPLRQGRPSAETLLHTRLYRRSPEIGAVLHTHSPTATILTRLRPDAAIVFSGYELQKAFHGITSHESELVFPVFDNSQDIPALVRRVDAWMDEHGTGHGYLIRGHGVYTWGRDMPECLRHLEALEFLLECEWRIYSTTVGGQP